MAIVELKITTTKTAVGGGQYDYSTSASSKTVNAGDTIRFKAVGDGTSIVVSGLSSSAFIDSNNVTVYVDGANVDRQTKSVTSQVVDSISINPVMSGYPTITRSVTVNPLNDTVPDNFNLPDTGGANRSTQYTSQYTVEGLTVSVSASISGGGASFKVNNGSASTSAKTVANGDLITVYMNSSSSYSASNTTTLTVGSSSTTFVITTTADLNQLTKLHFNIASGDIDTVSLENFLCGQLVGVGTGNTNVLHRSGLFVPDITENAGIPLAAPHDLQDFYSCATVFTLSAGQNKTAWNGDTDAGQTSQVLTWDIPQDIQVGYSPYMRLKTEFKHSVSVTAHGQYNTGQVTSSASSTWSKLNDQAWVRATVPEHSEGHFLVTVTVYARPTWDTSKVLTTTMTGRIQFWGV